MDAFFASTSLASFGSFGSKGWFTIFHGKPLDTKQPKAQQLKWIFSESSIQKLRSFDPKEAEHLCAFKEHKRWCYAHLSVSLTIHPKGIKSK